jgi:hypothetical protein
VCLANYALRHEDVWGSGYIRISINLDINGLSSAVFSVCYFVMELLMVSITTI